MYKVHILGGNSSNTHKISLVFRFQNCIDLLIYENVNRYTVSLRNEV